MTSSRADSATARGATAGPGASHGAGAGGRAGADAGVSERGGATVRGPARVAVPGEDALAAGGTGLAEFAALLADRTRAEICLCLVDGRAWTAGELARATRVAPSTASEHLNRLIAGGLLTEYRQGRHRYLRLAGRETADLLETLLAHIGPPVTRPVTLRAATAGAALARGRTCYDHLAGRLGVTLTEAMIARGLLDEPNGLALTDLGSRWFTD